MDISLVILAAGIGSRYGAGIKQLAKVGPNGELIIDYSIRDAIEAGFNKVVFILRKDIETDFMEIIGNRMEKEFSQRGVKWAYVFQELTDAPEGRTKPWGTGQALLCCKDVVDGPFAVLNADDYYGKTAFLRAFEFCSRMDPESSDYGMVGYILKNTITPSGGVTRGICSVDAGGRLIGVKEQGNILQMPDGKAVVQDETHEELDLDVLVSMNFWMFPPSVFAVLEEGFAAFRRTLKNPLKDEYLLPIIVDEQLRAGKCSVSVLSTPDRWLGITYREDTEQVRQTLKSMGI